MYAGFECVCRELGRGLRGRWENVRRLRLHCLGPFALLPSLPHFGPTHSMSVSQLSAPFGSSYWELGWRPRQLRSGHTVARWTENLPVDKQCTTLLSPGNYHPCGRNRETAAMTQHSPPQQPGNTTQPTCSDMRSVDITAGSIVSNLPPRSIVVKAGEGLVVGATKAGQSFLLSPDFNPLSAR